MYNNIIAHEVLSQPEIVVLSAALGKDYSCLEMFAGRAWVTRCLRWGGLPTASMDNINLAAPQDDGSPMNPWDLTTDAGMGWPGLH